MKTPEKKSTTVGGVKLKSLKKIDKLISAKKVE